MACAPNSVNEIVTSHYAADEKVDSLAKATNANPSYVPIDYLAATDRFRYDALGRRILERSTGAARYSNSITRFVWDGDRVLWEIHYETDVAGLGVIERDTGAVGFIHQCGNMRPSNPCGAVPGEPEWSPDTVSFDSNSGRVLYTEGLELDVPLTVTRLDYGYGTTRYDPITIVPTRNWRAVFDTGFVFGAGGIQIKWPGRHVATYRAHPAVTNESFGWFGNFLLDNKTPGGLHYKRNRFYDPISGRFTQEDPIGLAGGMNLYGSLPIAPRTP